MRTERPIGGASHAVLGVRNQEADPPPIPSIFDLLKRKFGLHVEATAPAWARRAAQMAFDSLVPKGQKLPVSEAYFIGFDSGYFHGAERLLASEAAMERETILKLHWARLSSEQAADFFCGYRDGEKLMRKVPERAQEMAQRTKIFQRLAANWKEIAPGVLNDTGQLHQWLLARKVISPRTDSAEIRLVCGKIGLRYKRPGKPRKSKM